jgi:hypothetical protein
MSVESDGGSGALLKVFQPDPFQPSRMLEYMGRVVVPEAIETATLSATQFSILEAVGWSAFEWNLREPLVTDEARWLRLYAKPRPPKINRRTACRRMLRLLTDRLRYTYEVFSPADVLYRFDVILSTLVWVLNPREPIEAEILSAATALREDWLEPALSEGTKTIVHDWRIHVFPRRLGRLSHAEGTGDVMRAGGLPNFVQVGNRLVVVYEWKAGKFNIKDQLHEGRFTINIEAEHRPVWVAWLRWLPLPVSLWWLVERIVSLIKR